MNVCAVIGLAFAFLLLPSPSCSNSDNMALLLGTLKMMQRASCDDDVVSLACPTATTISIQVAQYGKASASDHICVPDGPHAVEVVEEENCLWPNTLQYSLLQTVVEACQKKQSCKFSTKPKPGIDDPCPHTRKFVDVAYKCRPHEFRSQSCCQGGEIKLSCNPHSRVTIFDAQYGMNAYGPVTCHQNGAYDEVCMAPHALDIVMQICHGKRRCQIEASDRIFGSPCSSKTKTYLKVIYACVPLGVLKEKYESKLEEDERPGGTELSKDGDDFFDETEDKGESWREPNVIPALQVPEDILVTTTSKPEDDTTTPPSKKKTEYVTGSSHSRAKVEIFIYVGVAVILLIIIIVALLAYRYYRIRRSLRNSKNGEMFTTEPPNVFNDVSDIDNDIDVSHISGSIYDPGHPDMILYRDAGNRGTIRAMRPLSTIYPTGVSMYGNEYVPSPPREIRLHKEDEAEGALSPRSLGTYSNSQFYYG